MSRIKLFAFLATALLAVALHPAHAQWSDSERASCVKGCMGTCETNPNVSSKRDRCDVYCACACAGAESVVSNFRKFNEEFSTGNDTETTRAIRALIPACNTKAFSN